jgi:DNA-binding transcriptional LysR family regulator
VGAAKALLQADPLPLVTFGPDCFYQPFMAAALKVAKRASRIVVQAPTTAAVRAALSAGLGIGVLRKGQLVQMPGLYLFDELTRPLPKAAQVLRISRSLPRRIAGPLEAAIAEATVTADLL